MRISHAERQRIKRFPLTVLVQMGERNIYSSPARAYLYEDSLIFDSPINDGYGGMLKHIAVDDSRLSRHRGKKADFLLQLQQEHLTIA